MSSITLQTCLSGTPLNLNYVRDALKLRLRAWRNRRPTAEWLAMLNSHPALRELALAHPRLILKIYRPYLSHHLDCAQRASLLASHYRFMLEQGWGSLALQASRGAVPLVQFAGKSGAPYAIELQTVWPMEREGELVLQLRAGQDLVYSVAFSFFQSNGQMAVGIGCIQGPQGERGLELNREATRELHGLRPKSLMVRLVRQLGHLYGCQEMVLVSNANRAVRHSMSKGLVLADYDGLWQEMEARLRPDGDFALDCIPLPAPNMEEIPSKKRSEARKRHEMQEDVFAALGAALQAASNAPKPARAE
ncbi:VirK/YbjX family protein [Pseudoduganella violacea]|uniref:DUF535 domain-containing protein n=1 Tax=Pseudoduganella violacea TaxID=1715466 RepID=A0A7W5FSQ9_9BURK|nr:VirK/YbjX family protein [Pseudoduganella violacea]MBB3118039.1 hypothetical protein [Pseudoduganella violacea]